MYRIFHRIWMTPTKKSMCYAMFLQVKLACRKDLSAQNIVDSTSWNNVHNFTSNFAKQICISHSLSNSCHTAHAFEFKISKLLGYAFSFWLWCDAERIKCLWYPVRRKCTEARKWINNNFRWKKIEYFVAENALISAAYSLVYVA